jgi:hypothetical protein
MGVQDESRLSVATKLTRMRPQLKAQLEPATRRGDPPWYADHRRTEEEETELFI